MKLAFVTLLVTLSVSASCQLSQVSFSDDFKVINHDYRDQIVGNAIYHKNSFYSVTNSGIGLGKWLFTKLYDIKFDVALAQYSSDMKTIKEQKLDNGEKNFGPIPPSLFFMQNKLVLLHFKSENKSSYDLYLSHVDENSLALSNTKKICTFLQENVGILKLQSALNDGMAFVCNSIDGEKTLIACKTAPGKLQSYIIDTNLNVVRKTDIPAPGNGVYISSAVLTKDNLECLVIKSEQDTKIVHVAPDGRKGQKIISVAGPQKMYATYAKLANNGKSIYIYSATNPTGQRSESCNGLQLMKFDCAAMQFSKPVDYRFTTDVLEIIAQRDGKSERRSKEYQYDFRPVLIELENEKIVILGSPEMSEQSSYTTMDGNRSQTTVKTEMNVGPVIAFFPSVTGASLEHVLIPRKIELSKSNSGSSGGVSFLQVMGTSGSALGFIAKSSGNKIVILYNDNETNVNSSADQKTVKSKSTKSFVLAEAVLLDDKTIVHRKQIADNIKGSATYHLGNAVQNTSNQLVFPIGKDGVGFDKKIFTNWCFINF